MSIVWLTGFVGLAALYAVLLGAVLIAGLRWAGRFPGWGILPLMLSTLFFVFLTLHPFPPPDSIRCPVASAAPSLQPFAFLPAVTRLLAAGAGPGAWFGDQFVVATAMNYLLCVVIGVALARHVRPLWAAAALGLGLSLAAEVTQLSGLWGLYPCAIRQFSIDDLILNSLGVLSGHAAARALRGWRRGLAPPAGAPARPVGPGSADG